MHRDSNKRIIIRGENDGFQTPWKIYPIFVAQHATATCCRKCIEKWHKIPKYQDLSDEEVKYLAGLKTAWIKNEINSHN